MRNRGPICARLRPRAPPRWGLCWAWVGAWAGSCCVMQARAGMTGSSGRPSRPSEVCGPTLLARRPGAWGRPPAIRPATRSRPLVPRECRPCGPNALTAPGGRGL